MTNDDATGRVVELLRDARSAMLTTVAPDGTLTSRPMGIQEVDDDGGLWFFVEHGSRKVAHVAVTPQVNVTVATGTSWVSLTGDAVEVDDTDRARRLWNAGAEAWFPGGPDHPGLRLLRVRAASAEFWDPPGGRIATAISFVKATVTGERMSGGDNERVSLD